MKILGVDLGGSGRRATGVAFKEKDKINCFLLYGDSEILELAKEFTHVFIDAPLSLPMGRKSLEDKSGTHFRECDLLLRKLGIRLLPVTLGPMRMLTQRGIKLKRKLEGLKKEVYEVFPGAFYDLMKVGRKDKEAIFGLYKRMGLELEQKSYTQHELDAIACLLTGCMFLEGKGLLLKGCDGAIVIPQVPLKE